MKLIIDIPDMIYNILNGDSSWKGLSVDYILNAVKDGTPLEAQPNRCDSCIHSDERDGSNCYECVKGMADNFEAHMRDATEEERKSVKNYVESISKPTGLRFDEAQPSDAVDKRSLDSVIDTLQTWIKTADDEYDREEYWRVQGLREALQEIKKIKTFESSTNLVDRDAVINLVKYSLCDLKRDADKQIFVNTINSLPSVTPRTNLAETSQDCISILNRIMEYTYGMLTAEKYGLQHLIKSMMDELSGGDSE
jgi:hypothetical protein